MVDIDHFKKINDTCGHLAGDEALKAVSRVCEEMVRTTDCLARLGGEEFAVLMPQTALDQASAVAERLRAAVAGLRCDLQGSVVTLTVSIGVAIAEKSGEDLSSLMQRADLAMYEAKSKGRNCVVVAPGRAAKLVA
jgi:diguanylate cyclase (GGDEF)-like protein